MSSLIKAFNVHQQNNWILYNVHFAHAQDDLNLRSLRMLKGRFTLDEAQIKYNRGSNLRTCFIQLFKYT